MVACDAADSGHGWRERPSVILEIVSEETRRIDEREKRLAYLQLERLAGLDAVIELPTIGVELPVAELYDRLKLQ